MGTQCTYIYIYSTRYKRPFNLRVWWRTCWLSKWGYKTETFLLTTPIFLEPGKERLRKRSFLPLLISSHMPHFLSSQSSLLLFFPLFFLETLVIFPWSIGYCLLVIIHMLRLLLSFVSLVRRPQLFLLGRSCCWFIVKVL